MAVCEWPAGTLSSNQCPLTLVYQTANYSKGWEQQRLFLIINCNLGEVVLLMLCDSKNLWRGGPSFKDPQHKYGSYWRPTYLEHSSPFYPVPVTLLRLWTSVWTSVSCHCRQTAYIHGMMMAIWYGNLLKEDTIAVIKMALPRLRHIIKVFLCRYGYHVAFPGGCDFV